MFHKTFTPLLAAALVVAAAPVPRAQGLADAAKRADEQRKRTPAPEKKYDARSLPSPARVDATLGDFVINDTLAYRCRNVQVDLLKARRLDLDLDRYLLKWEFAKRSDPFGMADPMAAEPKVLQMFDRENLEVRDYLYYQVALNRALADRQEAKSARAFLSKPRLANLEFLERNENLLQPSYDVRTAEDDLERDRKYRARE